MTFEADLLSLLLADYDIADAVNDVGANERRIYPLERPQGQKNLRAIVYTIFNDAPAANLEEVDHGGFGNVRLQVDVWAKTFDEARELARLVRARMNAGNSSIRIGAVTSRSDRDPDTREYREILDYSAWHSPQ